MATNIPLFNPRHLSPDILEKMLVGRQTLLQELEEDLIRQLSSESRQHWLIRGPRGFGKTHLAGILYHRIRSHPTLSTRYIPVWLSETAAYEVYSAGTLLEIIAIGLTDELKAEKEELAVSLLQRITSITVGGDDPSLFEELDELLREVAGRTARTLLILMENLDALLEGFAKSRSNIEAKKLRELLSHRKEYLFISTTPTHYLPKISEPKAPLYGLLRERSLPPLSEEETQILFQRLRELTNSSMAPSTTFTRKEQKIRERVLHRLTGGSPRAIVMAFSVVSGIPGLTTLVEEFRDLLDRFTPYFEARLSALAPRERVIVTAMATASTNLTIKEIAQYTRLPERSLSTLVTRLVKEGLIMPSEGEGGKGTIYEVTDGLFRVWYQFRKANRILQPLVRFLAMWSSPVELDCTLRSLRSDEDAPCSVLESEIREATALQLEEALEYSKSDAGRMERERLWAECGKSAVHEDIDAFYYSIVKKPLLGAPGRRSPEDLRVAQSEIEGLLAQEFHQEAYINVNLLRLSTDVAYEFYKLDCYRETEGLLQRAIACYKESDRPELQEQVARAMVNLGTTLCRQGRHEDALTIFKEIIDRYKDSEHPELQEGVARAMGCVGCTMGELNRPEEQINTYRELIKEYKESDRSELQEKVASAMAHLGRALGRRGQVTEAENTFKEWVIFTKRMRTISQGTLELALISMAEMLPADTCKDFLQELQISLEQEPQDYLQLYVHILNALETQEPTSRKGGIGPGNRLRKTLARVPPELRKTVQEAVESILYERRRIRR